MLDICGEFTLEDKVVVEFVPVSKCGDIGSEELSWRGEEESVDN